MFKIFLCILRKTSIGKKEKEAKKVNNTEKDNPKKSSKIGGGRRPYRMVLATSLTGKNVE